MNLLCKKDMECFRERIAYYLKCVLEDQIYRTREKCSFNKKELCYLVQNLGRPNLIANKIDKELEY